MFEDEANPQPKLDLERLSVEELRDRIGDLKQQIIDCETELERKLNHKSAADALFGGSD